MEDITVLKQSNGEFLDVFTVQLIVVSRRLKRAENVIHLQSFPTGRQLTRRLDPKSHSHHASNSYTSSKTRPHMRKIITTT